MPTGTLKHVLLTFLLCIVIDSCLTFAFVYAQAPSSASIVIGARVRATRTLEVRNTPSSSGTLLGTVVLESRGSIVGGPISATNMVWWQVKYDSGPVGWSDATAIKPVISSRFFQQHSTWYEKLPAQPTVHPQSSAIINNITTHSASLGISSEGFSHPIFYARPNTPLVEVEGSNATSKAMGWHLVPIPDEARPAGYGRPGYSDAHIVVISHDQRYAWDMYNAVRVDATHWQARGIRRWDLSGDGLNSPDDGLGNVKLCPFPILHGLVTRDEVQRGVIDHALIVAVHNGPQGGYYWGGYPCEVYVGGGNPHSPPPLAGMRFQLDPALDVTTLGLSPLGQMVAKALQDYGMISADSASPVDFDLYFETLTYRPDGASWPGLLSGVLGKIPTDKLRVVESPRPPFASTPSAPSPMRVRTKQSVPIYFSPFNVSIPRTTLPAGSAGRVLSQPVAVAGVTWWFVDYDDSSPESHSHGWTKYDLLEVLSEVRPPSPRTLRQVQ